MRIEYHSSQYKTEVNSEQYSHAFSSILLFVVIEDKVAVEIDVIS